MKRRFSAGGLTAVAVALLALGAGFWWFLSRGGDADGRKEPEVEPVAPVEVAPLRRGRIERTLVAYGTAAAAPGGTRSVAYPFEARVIAVQANLGQNVAAGDTLLRIEPSADARLALDTARNAREAADRAWRDAQARFKARLATNTELAAAESAARDARLKLESLQGRAPDAEGIVKAPAAGIVTKLPAGPGMVVAPDGPLAEIAVGTLFEARLGIAPADAGEVKPGQTVHLASVQARGGEGAGPPAMLRGTVRLVGASIDPATRLVDVFVALDGAGAPVLIGTYLRAEIVVETKEALLAPRAAVLPGEAGGSGATVFTVRQGRAVRHEVGTGIDDRVSVEITPGGEALPEGSRVVTEGAYELEDKMKVEIGRGEAGKEQAAKEGETP